MGKRARLSQSCCWVANDDLKRTYGVNYLGALALLVELSPQMNMVRWYLHLIAKRTWDPYAMYVEAAMYIPRSSVVVPHAHHPIRSTSNHGQSVVL